MSEYQNPLFDLQNVIYNSKNYTRRRLHQLRLNWVFGSINKYAKNNTAAKVLEYGPGSGVYLPKLLEHCDDVTAADIENAYLDGIRPLMGSNKNLKLIEDNILDSQIKDESFDLILCSEVLEHLSNPEVALKTIYRVLSDGGIAIISTPQKYSLLELMCKIALHPSLIKFTRMIYQESVLETGHISLLSENEFITAAQSCGFKIIESKKFGLYVPFIAEFTGEHGGRFIEWLELRLPKNLSFMLWTQAYILRKA